MSSSEDFEVRHLVQPSGKAGGDDRVAVIRCPSGVALVAADGAGGTGGGARAAECLVALLCDAIEADETLDLLATLKRADRVILQQAQGGQTTGVVTMLGREGIRGAAVGDSEAWLIDERVQVLTAGQHRKPLLGTGDAVVVPFRAPPLVGTLVIGTDGFFKYTSGAKIADAVRGRELTELPARLVDLVRMRNGLLQDDVAVIVAGVSRR